MAAAAGPLALQRDGGGGGSGGSAARLLLAARQPSSYQIKLSLPLDARGRPDPVQPHKDVFIVAVFSEAHRAVATDMAYLWRSLHCARAEGAAAGSPPNRELQARARFQRNQAVLGELSALSAVEGLRAYLRSLRDGGGLDQLAAADPAPAASGGQGLLLQQGAAAEGAAAQPDAGVPALLQQAESQAAPTEAALPLQQQQEQQVPPAAPSGPAAAQPAHQGQQPGGAPAASVQQQQHVEAGGSGSRGGEGGSSQEPSSSSQADVQGSGSIWTQLLELQRILKAAGVPPAAAAQFKRAFKRRFCAPKRSFLHQELKEAGQARDWPSVQEWVREALR